MNLTREHGSGKFVPVRDATSMDSRWRDARPGVSVNATMRPSRSGGGPFHLRHLLVALPAAALFALGAAPSGSAEPATACGGGANWFESSQQPESNVSYWAMRVDFRCNKDFGQFKIHTNRRLVAVGGQGFSCKRRAAKTFKCKAARFDEDVEIFPTIRSKTTNPCRRSKVVVTVTASGESFTLGGPCGEEDASATPEDPQD